MINVFAILQEAPLALFIPCHRVIGKNNHGGYMGRADALPYKLDLLQHERSANIGSTFSPI